MKADLLGELIMTGVPGKELDGKTARLFRKVKPGAFFNWRNAKRRSVVIIVRQVYSWRSAIIGSIFIARRAGR